MMPRVAFVTSHPIQYQVPVFRHLARRGDVDFEVFFGMLPDATAQGTGFGVEFEWDLPLLEGYEYTVLNNISRTPGVTNFRGCDTPEIVDQLRQHRIDAVVVNGWVVKTCLQALKACRKLNIPCIVRGEANNLRPRPLWKRLIQRQLIRRYDAVLPIGSANRDFYRSHGVPDQQMFDARYCIENDRFAQVAESFTGQESAIRAGWEIPDDVLCLLYCGKFETKKHPVELLHALKDAVAAGARLHLLMVGDGDLKPDCEALVRNHNLPVSFTGFLNQSQIVQAYVAADALALPSDHGETWGLVVNEGMVCGLPAIVSDQVGCASDLIVQNQTGWVFPFGAWDQLTELMVSLGREPENVRKLGASCRELIEKYSPAAAADGITEAVHAVVGSRLEAIGG